MRRDLRIWSAEENAKAPKGPPTYSLCVVSVASGDKPPYYLDGAEIQRFTSHWDALTALEALAADPISLAKLHQVPNASFLVINDFNGREVTRQPIRGARVALPRPRLAALLLGFFRSSFGALLIGTACIVAAAVVVADADRRRHEAERRESEAIWKHRQLQHQVEFLRLENDALRLLAHR